MADTGTTVGRRTGGQIVQANGDFKSSELGQARMEGTIASDTRRAIALCSGPLEESESKNVSVGIQLIDSAFDTQEVAQVRSLSSQLKWDSEKERKTLAAYAAQKLSSIDSNAPDASTAALVMLTILQQLMPDKAEELGHLMQTVRDKVERSLRITSVSDLGDVAHAVKSAQIIGDLSSDADHALEHRVLVAARARLHAVEPSVIAKFIGAKLQIHKDQRVEDASALKNDFERALGYKPKVVAGSAILTRGTPSAGFEELAQQLQRQRGQYFYTTESGDRWGVSAAYRVGSDMMISLEREGTDSSFTIRRVGLIQMLKNRILDAHLHQVAANGVAESHLDFRKALRNHDLTRNGTAYITVTPQKYDIVTAATVTYAALLENVLMRRYGRTLEPIHIVSDSPIDQIRAVIRESLKRAPQTRDIFLQLHEHGAEQGIGFSPLIKAKDLARLSQEFPQVDLHVMTIACFGGGLRPALQHEMQKDPALRQRLHFYSHTQPEVEAVALGTGGSNHVYDIEMSSTPYMLTLIKKLAEGRVKTFGEAVDEADSESQKVAPINPETLLNGEFFGKAQHSLREESFA